LILIVIVLFSNFSHLDFRLFIDAECLHQSVTK
jgi:hypothetical protein